MFRGVQPDPLSYRFQDLQEPLVLGFCLVLIRSSGFPRLFSPVMFDNMAEAP